jgi:hypothetical protein
VSLYVRSKTARPLPSGERRSCARVAPVSLIVIMLATRVGFGQTHAINGSIRGRVTDPATAAVPQSSVTAENTQTGYKRTTETGDDGYYVIPNLPLGRYTVTVLKQGFETQRHSDVMLDAGTEATIDVQLKMSELRARGG